MVLFTPIFLGPHQVPIRIKGLHAELLSGRKQLGPRRGRKKSHGGRSLSSPAR